MKTEWKEFLENAGAIFEDGAIAHFGNRERERQVAMSGEIITDLSHYGLIAAYGEEAETFLQGQFCNDVRNVDENTSQVNGYCSPKGRLLSIFRLFKIKDTYYQLIPQELVEETLKRLRMFILISKVTLGDADNALVRIGFSGPDADTKLKDILGKVPEQNNAVIHTDDVTVIRIPGPCPRFIILGDVEAIKNIWSKLNVHAAPVGMQPWGQLDVLAGIPQIYPQTVDAFVPQMVNMQAIDGVSFKKGCYTGQEVVARMQYLGKLKRRMFKANIKTDEAVMPGDPLFAGGDTSGQGTGKIVSAFPSDSGGYDVLAVVQIASVEKTKVHLKDKNGPVLEWGELPYTLE
ncbi:MAG: folate-binding protein [Gammaproteobacteria bacterium]|nr:folate-binding protein [Gammaproteobacteria bacterium]